MVFFPLFKEFARLSYLWEHNPVLLLYFSEGVCLQISQNNGDKVLYSPGSTIKYNADEGYALSDGTKLNLSDKDQLWDTLENTFKFD